MVRVAYTARLHLDKDFSSLGLLKGNIFDYNVPAGFFDDGRFARLWKFGHSAR